jgi:hypothetical protein
MNLFDKRELLRFFLDPWPLKNTTGISWFDL